MSLPKARWFVGKMSPVKYLPEFELIRPHVNHFYFKKAASWAGGLLSAGIRSARAHFMDADAHYR